jgi:hypothetical protein
VTDNASSTNPYAASAVDNPLANPTANRNDGLML